MKYLLLFSLLSLVGLVGCEDSTRIFERQSASIIGGEKAVVGDFPTTVSLLANDISYCTGTLISKNLVLTAAHCVDFDDSSTFLKVGFDLENVRNQDNGRLVEIEKIVIHERWGENADPETGAGSHVGAYDIALIWLKEEITDRLPTPINRFVEDVPFGTKVTHAGYGATQEPATIAPDTTDAVGILYSIEQETKQCTFIGIQFPTVNADETLLCFTQYGGDGFCRGDSGGPALIKVGAVTRIAGIMSFLIARGDGGNSNCNHTSASTRIDAELDFLFKHAPQLQCQADGVCNDICGLNSLPIDDDCVNECELKTDDCDPEAICSDTPDSYTCACPAPYIGDGLTCIAPERDAGMIDGDMDEEDTADVDMGYADVSAPTEIEDTITVGGGCSSVSKSNSSFWLLVFAILGFRTRKTSQRTQRRRPF